MGRFRFLGHDDDDDDDDEDYEYDGDDDNGDDNVIEEDRHHGRTTNDSSGRWSLLSSQTRTRGGAKRGAVHRHDDDNVHEDEDGVNYYGDDDDVVMEDIDEYIDDMEEDEDYNKNDDDDDDDFNNDHGDDEDDSNNRGVLTTVEQNRGMQECWQPRQQTSVQPTIVNNFYVMCQGGIGRRRRPKQGSFVGDGSEEEEEQQVLERVDQEEWTNVIEHEDGTIDFVPVDAGGHYRRRRRRFVRCGFAAAVCLVAIWFRREGPPGPPPQPQTSTPYQPNGGRDPSYAHGYEYVTWNEYLERHSTGLVSSTVALFWHAPMHLVRWFCYCRFVDVQRIYDKAVEYYDYYVSSNPSPRGSIEDRCCPIPTTIHDTTFDAYVSSHIVGQSRAMYAIRQALQTWTAAMPPSIEGDRVPAADDPSNAHAHRQRERSHRPSRRPLVSWWSGARGTGKRSSARRVSRMLLAACRDAADPDRRNGTSDGDRNRADPSDAGDACILSIDGANYAHLAIELHERQRSASLSPPVWSSLEHAILHAGGASSRSRGSVVLVDNADQIPYKLLSRILQQLKGTKPISSPGSLPVLDHDRQESKQSLPTLVGCCSHTVFILMSSKIGLKSIARALRANGGGIYSGLGVPSDSAAFENPTVHLDMSHEIDTHYAKSDSMSNNNEQHATTGIDTTVASISSYLDAIIPFVPLTRMDLATILNRRILEEYNNTNALSTQSYPWSTFRVSDTAVEALLDGYMEFIEWTHHDTSIRTFASEGATPIERRIMPHLRTVLQHKCFPQQGDGNIKNQGYDNDDNIPVSATLDIATASATSLSSSWSSWSFSTSSSSTSEPQTSSSAQSYHGENSDKPQGIVRLCKYEDSFLYRSCRELCRFPLT